ncbi:MAG TPA: GNAT family N-acetyltransferase [Thermomicrobiales bacterium]
MTDAVTIETLTAPAAGVALPELVAVLADAVAGGASVGFLPPLVADDGRAYWRGVGAAIDAGSRVLLVARVGGGPIVGTVQLDLATRANGLHRAEVSKLIVARSARRQGLGRRLMLALETEARRLGRTTIVLDTRQGDPSEALYAGLGYQLVGVIPAYARSADGSLHATAFYYKLLAGSGDAA